MKQIDYDKPGDQQNCADERPVFWKPDFSGMELFWAFVAIGLIFLAYIATPSRYQLKSDWEDAAICVVIATVVIAAGWRFLWGEIAFWMSLFFSSTIHLAVVHAWVRGGEHLSRGTGKLATLLGFFFFLAVYGCMQLFRRNFYGEGTPKSG